MESVEYQGNKRTLKKTLDSVLGKMPATGTLEQVHAALVGATQQLERTGCFKSVDAVIDESEKSNRSADIRLVLDEKEPYSVNAGTYLRAGEASLEARLRARNGFGLLEDISLNASRGTYSSTAMQLHATFPVLQQTAGTAFDARAYWSDSSFQRHCSFTERLKGATAALRWPGAELAYDLAWRELADASKFHTASPSVRSQLVRRNDPDPANAWCTGIKNVNIG